MPVSLALSALLLADIFGIAIRLHTLPAPGVLRSTTMARVQGVQRVSAATTIIGAHLFGRVAQIETAAAGEDLGLRLTGTLASQDPHRGSAIIMVTANGEQHLFATGAPLPGGRRLELVYADRVGLSRDGNIQYLALPRFASSGQRRGADRGVAPVPAPLQDTEVADDASAVSTSPAQTWLSSVYARAVTDDSGRLVGYSIHPTLRAQKAYGIENNDLITEINGAPVEAPEQIEQLLQGASGSTLVVTVTRAGVPQTVTIPLH